jgi:hypothetical protein
MNAPPCPANYYQWTDIPTAATPAAIGCLAHPHGACADEDDGRRGGGRSDGELDEAAVHRLDRLEARGADAQTLQEVPGFKWE